MSNPFLFFVQVFLPVVSTAASASTTQTKINAITLPYQQLTHDQEPHVLNLSTPHDGASTASTMAIKGRLQQHPRSGHVGWHRNGVMSNPFLFFVQVFLPVVSTAASASTTQTKINAITLPYQQLTHDQEPHVLNLSTPHDGASTASTMAIKGRLQQHPRSGHVGWHRNGVMSNPFLFFVQVFLPVVSTAASASTTQTKINAITLPYQQLTHDQEPHVLNLSTPHDGASTASTMAIKGRLQQHPRSGHVGWHRNGVMSNPFLFFVQLHRRLRRS
ncbi:uncharacterized protein LOC142814233 isoform X2 [Rhipicephalus microplus]|uniref:uncharacterized protein LOC142814233 isoform X2 n=1 Tax=Rhipicephalus microplus TaxID=6941 RepID=UPI003F6B334B